MAKYYFIEVNEKFGSIDATHCSTSMDLIFENSKGLLIEVDENTYNVLEGCRHDIKKGIKKLQDLEKEIKMKIEQTKEDKNDTESKLKTD